MYKIPVMFPAKEESNITKIILTVSTGNINKLSEILLKSLEFKMVWRAENRESNMLYNPLLSESLLIHLVQENGYQEMLSEEHLLIFYINNEKKFLTLCEQLSANEVQQVPSFNPYWDQQGTTFLLPDQLRIVLCRDGYSEYKSRIAMPSNSLSDAQIYFEKQLGFKKIAGFEDHAGFDGIMLATSKLDCHLELTYCHNKKHSIVMPISENRFSVGLMMEIPNNMLCRSYNDGQGHHIRIWESAEVPDISLEGLECFSEKLKPKI